MEPEPAMNKNLFGIPHFWRITRDCLAILCSVLLVPNDLVLGGQTQGAAQSQTPGTAPPAQTTSTGGENAAVLPPDQLDSLVAPIALYPDPMLAQVLAASTYPLELIQLQQWLAKHKDLKDKAGKPYKGVRQQFVKLGSGRGDQVAVLSGVQDNEEVVTSGVFKLRNGASVMINNQTQPSDNPSPRPEEN